MSVSFAGLAYGNKAWGLKHQDFILQMLRWQFNKNQRDDSKGETRRCASPPPNSAHFVDVSAKDLIVIHDYETVKGQYKEREGAGELPGVCITYSLNGAHYRLTTIVAFFTKERSETPDSIRKIDELPWQKGYKLSNKQGNKLIGNRPPQPQPVIMNPSTQAVSRPMDLIDYQGMPDEDYSPMPDKPSNFK